MSVPPAAPAALVSGVTHGAPLGREHLPHIRQLLEATFTHDNAERTRATERIEQLKHHPGWRVCVLQLALHGTGDGVPVSEELRTMALIQVKNQIDLLFRRTFGPSALSRDAAEKDAIKTMLLQFHTESMSGEGVSDRVAGFVSVCTGMVARHEWPTKWPELFPKLLEGLQSSQQRTVSRTLYTLHQSMKALQASRLCTSRAKFQSATEAILTRVRTQWMSVQEHCVNTIGAVVASGNAQAFTAELNASLVESTRLSLLFLKCLRRLILYGISDIGTSAETNLLFPFFLDQLQKLVHLLPKLRIPPSASNPSPTQFPFLEHLFGTALIMLRTVHQTLDMHATQFKGFFMPFVQFSMHVLQHSATTLAASSKLDGADGAAELGPLPETTALEPICVECMQYLQAVVRLYSRPPAMMQSLLVTGLALARAKEGGAGGAQVESTMAQIYAAMDGLFTPALLQQLLTLLLQHYLVLKHADMELWQSQPEMFYNEERSGCSDGDDGTGDDTTLVVMNARGDASSSSSHEYTLRMVAETLIKTMLEKYSEVIAPALVQMLMQILQTCPPGTVPAHVAGQPNLLLMKESIYSALGYGYLHIPHLLQSTHNISFPSFFLEVLSKELGNPSTAYRIIRRRVIWLVGEWVEQVTDESRMPIYHAIVSLLKENDLLVRMTAIDTLYKLIDNVSYSFEHGLGGSEGDSEHDVLDLTTDAGGQGSAGYQAMLNQFSVHLRDVLTLLFQILQHQLEELPTKQHVLFTVSKIVGAMKSRIVSSGCIDTLLHYLPLIWSECIETQNLLRTSVLDVITKLVVALDYKSQSIHAAVVLPMLGYVLDPKNTAKETNLWVEQALELWKHTLQHCVTYTPQMGDLFNALLAYMSSNTAHLQLCVEIIESYIHLGREEFMHAHAGHIGDLFASLLSSSNQIRPDVASSKGTLHTGTDSEVVTEQAIVVLMPVLEAVVQIYPSQAPMLFQRTFAFMLQAILDSARVHALTDEEQNRTNIHVPSDQVLAGYFTVLGRLFFQNFDGALQLLRHLSGGAPGQLPIAANDLLATVIEVCTRKLNAIVNVYKKKVCVLGLVRTLETNDPIVVAKLKCVMTAVRLVEMELAQPGAYLEQPDWSQALATPPEQRIESHRIQLMLKDDPSNHVGVRAFFIEKMDALGAAIGAQALQHVINTTCEPHVWNQVREGHFGPAR